mmetsp:Transcript_28981/g.76458  ORF Transcript_28981/g.76458 Transcript_28981/m.76458 type:complete len:269 (+) Transcript_28981:416-1222(+)
MNLLEVRVRAGPDCFHSDLQHPLPALASAKIASRQQTERDRLKILALRELHCTHVGPPKQLIFLAHRVDGVVDRSHGMDAMCRWQVPSNGEPSITSGATHPSGALHERKFQSCFQEPTPSSRPDGTVDASAPETLFVGSIDYDVACKINNRAIGDDQNCPLIVQWARQLLFYAKAHLCTPRHACLVLDLIRGIKFLETLRVLRARMYFKFFFGFIDFNRRISWLRRVLGNRQLSPATETADKHGEKLLCLHARRTLNRQPSNRGTYHT